ADPDRGSAGDAGPAVGTAQSAAGYPPGRGAACLLQLQRRSRACRVFPADPVDRANRRAERGAGVAVRTGRLVLHAVGGAYAAAVRRLPAGEPVEAGQGRATAKLADLSQG